MEKNQNETSKTHTLKHTHTDKQAKRMTTSACASRLILVPHTDACTVQFEHYLRQNIIANYVRWQLLGTQVRNAVGSVCGEEGDWCVSDVCSSNVDVTIGGANWSFMAYALDERFPHKALLEVGVQTAIQLPGQTAQTQGGKLVENGGVHPHSSIGNTDSGASEQQSSLLHDATCEFGGYERQKGLADSTMRLFMTDAVLQGNVDVLPTGLLVHGMPGTGKSYFVKCILRNWRERLGKDALQVLEVRSSELHSRVYGRNESVLRDIFGKAFSGSGGDGKCRLSVVVIDDLDLICPNRSNFETLTLSESMRRLVSALLSLMDRVERHNKLASNRCKVLVIGITSHLSRVDSAVQRPGRFDREIELGVPSVQDRKTILRIMLSQLCNGRDGGDIVSINDFDSLVEYAGEKAHGFVASDMKSLCQELLLAALGRAKQVNRPSDISSDFGSLALTDDEHHPRSCAVITLDDLRLALSKIKPSAIREVLVEVPHVKWSDIGGQEEAKQLLREAVEWQVKHRESFERMGIRPPKGILLYGPPGCSKTMMAKALATEAGLNFLAVRGPELFSKWVGDSEKAVREVFRKARNAKPSIIFFDEIDGLALERGAEGSSSGVGDRVLSQLLNELDGMDRLEGVTVIAATNRPDLLDKALLRPGRIDRQLYVRIPDMESRLQILRIHLSKVSQECLHKELLADGGGDAINSTLNDDALRRVAEVTHGYSGAEMSALCREASYQALQENVEKPVIRLDHLLRAKSHIKPRLNKQMIDFYEQYYQSKKRQTK